MSVGKSQRKRVAVIAQVVEKFLFFRFAFDARYFLSDHHPAREPCVAFPQFMLLHLLASGRVGQSLAQRNQRLLQSKTPHWPID